MAEMSPLHPLAIQYASVNERATPHAARHRPPTQEEPTRDLWGLVPRDDQKVNVPDITVVASTDASTRATFRLVSAAICISQPG